MSTRVILYSGNQRTYVTEKLAKTINLQLNIPERLAVVTFRSNRPKYLQYTPSKLQFILKQDKLMILDGQDYWKDNTTVQR